MKSIIQEQKECFLCRIKAERAGYHGSLTPYSLHNHHIFFGTSNRKQSEKYGLKVWLCPDHHEFGPDAVHRKRSVDLSLKGIAQRKFEETHTRAEFIEIFGKSRLD